MIVCPFCETPTAHPGVCDVAKLKMLSIRAALFWAASGTAANSAVAAMKRTTVMLKPQV
jgi:hypothetical protein